MSPLLILSTIAISAALVFYTWGVFGERRSGTLTRKYVTLFWIGLACDTTGTLMMSSMAAQTAGGMGVHGITGVVAIVLMLIHATWATWTYLRGSEQAQKRFHTFSTVVWLAWLVPYIIGILMGIPAIHLKAVCAAGTSVIVVALLSVILALPRHRRYQSDASSVNPNVLLLPQERGVRVTLETKVAQLLELILVAGRIIRFVAIVERLQHLDRKTLFAVALPQL